MLKWFIFLGWQVKKETLSHRELSVYEGGTASAVTPFSKADLTDFKLTKKVINIESQLFPSLNPFCHLFQQTFQPSL